MTDNPNHKILGDGKVGRAPQSEMWTDHEFRIENKVPSGFVVTFKGEEVGVTLCVSKTLFAEWLEAYSSDTYDRGTEAIKTCVEELLNCFELRRVDEEGN